MKITQMYHTIRSVHRWTYNAFAIISIILLGSCEKGSVFQGEIDKLNSRVDNIDERLQLLESKVNSNANSLLNLLNSVSGLQISINGINDSIDDLYSNGKGVLQSIAPVKQEDEVIGYVLTFSNGQSFTIYTSCQDAPILLPKLYEDGFYYWTINGEWILHEGKMLSCDNNTVYVRRNDEGWCIVYYVNESPILGTPYVQQIPSSTPSTPIMNVRIAGPFAYLTLYNGMELKLRIETHYFNPLDIETSILPGQQYRYTWELGYNLDGRFYVDSKPETPTGYYTAQAYFADVEKVSSGASYDIFTVGASVSMGWTLGNIEMTLNLTTPTEATMPSHFTVVIELYYSETEDNPQWTLVQRENVHFRKASLSEYSTNYVFCEQTGGILGDNAETNLHYSSDLNIELCVIDGDDWLEVKNDPETKSMYKTQHFYVSVAANNSPSPRFGKLAYCDKASGQILSYCAVLQSGTDDIIIFEDHNTEVACVATFDKDGDGKVSYREASGIGFLYDMIDWDGNITPSKNNITGNTKINRFPELKYFPELMRYVGAFEGCTSLTEVIFHDNVIQEIPTKMFKGCSSLKSFTLPEGVKVIGASAFEGSGLNSIEIPQNVECKEAAFKDCKELTKVTFNWNSRTVISESLFEGCEKLEKFNSYESYKGIESSIIAEYIGNRAFYGTGFNDVHLNISTTRIGKRAFANTKVQTINLRAETIGYGAFEDNEFLTSVSSYYEAADIENNTFNKIIPTLKIKSSVRESYSDKGWLEYFQDIIYF